MSASTEQSDASPNVQLERPTLRNMAQLAACAIHDLAHAGGGFGSVRDTLVDLIEFAFLEHIKKCHAQGDEQHADYPSGNEAWLELPYSIREDLEMKSWISGYDHAGVRAAIARQEAEAPGDKPLRVNCPPSDLLRSLTPEELAALPPVNEAEIREALEQGGRELEAVRTGRPVRPSPDTRSDRPAPCACGSIGAFHYPGCILYREGSSPEGLPPDGSTPTKSAAAPRILGRETTVVTPGERRCTVQFGPLEAGYAYIPNRDGIAHPPFNYWIKMRAHEHRGAPIDGSAPTEAGAIAAIEQALFAIRASISGQTAPTAAVDLEALKRIAEAATRKTRAWCGDTPVYSRDFGKTFEPTVVVALIAELEHLRAALDSQTFVLAPTPPEVSK